MSSVVNALSYAACVGCVGLGLALTNAVAAPDVEKIPDLNTSAGFFYLDSITESEPHQRIVERRPRLYLFKRAVNPLSWMGKLFETTLFAAEKSRLHALAQKREISPKQAGIKPLVAKAGTGSGIGPGISFFHHALLGRDIEIDIPLMITYKNYQTLEFRTRFPLVGNHRLSFDLQGAYRSRPSDNFFGIGNDRLRSEKTKFRSVTREVLVGASSTINEAWKAGLHLSYRNIGISDPIGLPSAQDVFQTATVPGLHGGAQLLSTILSLENSTKDTQYLSTRGGFRRLDVSLNEGIGRGDFSYWKYRVDLQQFFPLEKSGRKIIAVRSLFETNQEKGGSRIPFFDLISLGGANTMRSLQNFRYYDKSGLAFLLEYRYRIWHALDWALFLEEGQVAPEPGDFGWNRFHTGYGFRLLLRASPKFPIPAGFDFGHSKEGWRVYFRYRPEF